MSGINKVILVGNLGRDPESRSTAAGDAVCNFTIATSESWKDKNTDEKQEKTEWHRIVTFKRLAEICGQYLTKGSKVYIEGKLQTRKWQGQDGVDRYTTEIVAREMQMLDSKGPHGSTGQQNARQAASAPKDRHGNQRSNAQNGAEQAREYANLAGDGGGVASAAANQEFDDDIPF